MASNDEELVISAVQAGQTDTPPPEDAPADAPVESGGRDTPSDAAPSDAGGDAPAWQAKYKTPEAMWDAYKQLEQKFHTDQQQAAQQQEEPEPAFQPLMSFTEPTSVDELYLNAQSNAQETAIWALNNQNRIPQDALREVVNHWYAQDPFTAGQYIAASQQQQAMQAYQQQIEPLNQMHNETQAAAAEAEAVRELPNYPEYKERIGAWIVDNQNAAYLQDLLSKPNGMYKVIEIAHAQLMHADWRSKARADQAQAQQQQDSAPPAGSKTQTRRTAADPADDGYADGIRELMLKQAGLSA